MYYILNLVSWSVGNDPNAAISYVAANGDRGMIHIEHAGADDVPFPAIPTNVV